MEKDEAKTEKRQEGGKKGKKEAVKETCCYLGSCVEEAERAARRLSACKRPTSCELKCCKT